MNLLADIHVKITIKQEIYKHTHTHIKYCPKQFFSVTASVLAFTH